MGYEFIVQEHAHRVTVGANLQQFIIMPNQPLSALFIDFEGILTAANVNDSWLSFLANLPTIKFTWKGQAIWSVSALDLARMCRSIRAWKNPMLKATQAANARRLVTLCIPFGRKLWNANECFPQVDKGTTQLELDFLADGATYKTFKFSCYSLQLLSATPSQFIRVQTTSLTPSATGNNDIDLPRLYPLAGIGVSTTNAEPLAALDDIETLTILKNWIQYDYALISANSARALNYGFAGPDFGDLEHVHVENVAGAYAQFATTLTETFVGSLDTEWHYLDFDPMQDGAWLLDAASATDLKLRLNFNTVAACRILPVEIWPATTIKPAGGA